MASGAQWVSLYCHYLFQQRLTSLLIICSRKIRRICFDHIELSATHGFFECEDGIGRFLACWHNRLNTDPGGISSRHIVDPKIFGFRSLGHRFAHCSLKSTCRFVYELLQHKRRKIRSGVLWIWTSVSHFYLYVVCWNATIWQDKKYWFCDARLRK